MPASVFPDHYDLDVFKNRVNRLFLTGQARPPRHLKLGVIVVSSLLTLNLRKKILLLFRPPLFSALG